MLIGEISEVLKDLRVTLTTRNLPIKVAEIPEKYHDEMDTYVSELAYEYWRLIRKEYEGCIAQLHHSVSEGCAYEVQGIYRKKNPKHQWIHLRHTFKLNPEKKVIESLLIIQTKM